MMRDKGAPRRTASNRGISSVVPSLILSSGRNAFFAACASIISGVPRDNV